jgi:hypothetical protein
MWYPDKAALRVGYVTGTHWDKDSIGIFSFAAGYNTKALGQYSVAVGGSSSATGNRSFAAGSATTASGSTAVAMNESTIASGSSSTAMGSNTIAAAANSTAMGSRNVAKSFAGLVIGVNNDTIIGVENALNLNTRLFEIGNGQSNVRHNAMTVLANGNVGIGTTSPSAELDVSGRTNTDKLQVGTGTVLNNIQSGTFTAGTSATTFKSVTITFPAAFASAPRVIASARNDPAYNVNDTFTVTVRSVSATAVTLNIQRVDVAAAWGQNLLIDWLAIQ